MIHGAEERRALGQRERIACNGLMLVQVHGRALGALVIDEERIAVCGRAVRSRAGIPQTRPVAGTSRSPRIWRGGRIRPCQMRAHLPIRRRRHRPLCVVASRLIVICRVQSTANAGEGQRAHTLLHQRSLFQSGLAVRLRQPPVKAHRRCAFVHLRSSTVGASGEFGAVEALNNNA